MSSNARKQEKRDEQLGRDMAREGSPRDLLSNDAQRRGYDAELPNVERERQAYRDKYSRPYSLREPKELRDEISEGLQTCQRLIASDRLLDEIDAAKDVYDLRECVKKLAQMVTGRV